MSDGRRRPLKVGFGLPDSEDARTGTTASWREIAEVALRAEAAGFDLVGEENRRQVAIDFFARLQAQAGSGTAPPLGLHNLMGPTVREKVANMMAAVRANDIAPIQMIFSATPR